MANQIRHIGAEELQLVQALWRDCDRQARQYAAQAAFFELLGRAGNRSALGQALGVSRQAAYNWEGPLYEHYVLRAERAYGISRYRLRPDLWIFEIEEES